MFAEHRLHPSDLIWPLFVTEGSGIEEPIASLPGVSRWSVDLIVARAREAAGAGIEALGVRLLINESAILERNGAFVHLAGIDDPHYFQVDNFDRATQHIPPDAAAILLAHSPEPYRLAAHAGFDLMLSGHTHGGQVCLPGEIALMTNADCPRRFCKGPWRYHTMQGYTSVGSGSSVVGVRFNCPPEITLHRLRVRPDQ